MSSGAAAEPSPAQYQEPHRPQFHFSPEANWANDPNGLVYHDGEFHLFFQHNPLGNVWGNMSWGHAVSRDLVHWQQLPVALRAEGDEAVFSGSVVVDEHNSSGLGTPAEPPLVAVYTSARPGSQAQALAYSTDRGRTWTKYAGNPVLDIGSGEFRDPKVFWHEPEQRWVMAVALPVERKVALYASRNLIDWRKLSEFGPANAVGGVWECPDLFPLSVDGNPAEQKWVLIVSLSPGAIAGGSGAQYFVGDFDGTRFRADGPATYTPPAGDVYADFEGADYGEWTTTGSAFGAGPAAGTLPGQQPVSGFEGARLVNSFRDGDGTTGTLTSPPFTIRRPFVNLLVGGGAHVRLPGSGDGSPPAGEVFADFEGDTWGPGWTATGTFADRGPAAGALPGQLPVSGFAGERLANTFYEGDGGTGTITSPEFEITRDHINFLVGGGPHQETAVTLVVDGTVVRRTAGRESEALDWASWDVSALKGRRARIEIVDQSRSGWGHVLVDHIMLSDLPALPRSTETAVNLLVDGEIVRTASGEESERLDWVAWNVADLLGREARIEVVDRNTGGWGHILADQISFADAPALSSKQRSSWLDHGKDNYAAISWNGVPGGRRLILGWMSNWQYADLVPTSPWRGAMTVPRELRLETIDGRLQLVQQPVPELRAVRDGLIHRGDGRPLTEGTHPLGDGARGQTVELEAVLRPRTAHAVGVEVLAGADQATVIGYDVQAQELYVDRTRSGDTGFSSRFAGVQRAPLPLRNGELRLRILVDRSSVEVFAARGQVVITDQVFPDAAADGVRLFARGGGADVKKLRIHRLRSIWPR